MKKSRRKVASFLILVFLIHLLGCKYYKIGSAQAISGEYILQKSEIHDYLVVHVEDDFWHLDQVKLVNDTIMGRKRPMSSLHSDYEKYQYRQGSVHRFTKNTMPTNEVHIYVRKYDTSEDNNVNLAVTDIIKIEVYDLAVGVTVATYVGTTFLIATVVSFVVLLIACSCPYAYSYNDETISFEGAMYSGANMESLERHDYMKLNKSLPESGELKLQIVNKKMELQYINMAELLVVQHSINTKIVIDAYGNFHTISNPQKPLSARTSSSKDYLSEISEQDNQFYNFDEEDLPSNNELILTFNKKDNANQAKIVLNTKNSMWAGYVYDKFTELFGKRFNAWMKKQGQLTEKQILKIRRDQGAVISIYILKDNEWEFLNHVNPVGSLVARDIIIPIDLSNHSSNEVKIKLEAGFMLWDLDYVAIDYTKNEEVTVKTIPPKLAEIVGENHSQSILLDDASYIYLDTINNSIKLHFDTGLPQIETNSTVRSIFLHSKGFYKEISSSKIKPNLKELRLFKEPSYLSKYSQRLYHDLLEANQTASND